MASVPQPQFMTAEELMDLPDDGNAYELDGGRLIVMPPAQLLASWVSAQIFARVSEFVRIHDLGIFLGEQGGVRLGRNPDTVRAPDVSFIRKDRIKDFHIGYFEGAPDLVVEVLSPSDRPTRVARKVQQYLNAGARLVWVVDPDVRSAAIYRPGHDVIVLDEDGVLDGEDVLPGFTLALSEMWV